MFDFFKTIFTGFSEKNNEINPASGLPMMDSGIDVAGNPYGFDSNNYFNNDTFNTDSFFKFD